MRGIGIQEDETVAWLDSLAPWDVFFTGTCRYVASCRSLKKSYERFMRDNYKSISYVYALEPHKNHGFHVHAMFETPYCMNWKRFWGEWYDKYGINRTEPMRHKPDVESYVSKYIIKEWNKEEQLTSVDQNQEIWWNVKISNRQFKTAAAA